ncbi:Fic family protein [bacterium]|nr:Fic family protein [bacterium]
MKQYIWTCSAYPNFTYNNELILSMLTNIKLKQGYLLGKMANLGFINDDITFLKILTEDILKSSEIEGLKLDTEQVRSSIAKRLGLNFGGDVYIERNVDGIVDMMLDATQNYNKKITKKRLCGWQNSMFPNGYSGLTKIVTGKYRDDKNGVMQVVSGAIGHETVHYEAPPAELLNKEMSALIDYINNETKTDNVIKAGIVHLWFVIIHPFEDGNGRIARALTDMMLARSENSPKRFYSMSSQIKQERKSYYKMLEITQKGSVDITEWLKWFLTNLEISIDNSDSLLNNVFEKSNFWKVNRNVIFNERQKKILDKLFDDFEGNLTTTKWAKICGCSQDTATRDIQDLINKNILEKIGQAKSTHYVIKE